MDLFGDHLLGCGYDPMRIRWHDALCDVVFNTFLQDNSGCKREEQCSSGLDRSDDVYYPEFLYGKPAHFDVAVHNPLQNSLFSQSAVTAGVAVSWGRWRKMLTMRRQCWVLEEFLFPWLWSHWDYGL